jgi:hypothetical protein
MTIKPLVFCTLTIFIYSASANAEVMLDSFETGPVTVTADTANSNVTVPQNSLSADEVVLGLRRTTVQGDLASGFVEAQVSSGTATYISNDPEFNVSTIFGVSFDGRLLLTYLADNRFEPFDLTSLPGDTFAIDVESVSLSGDSAPEASIALGGGRVAFDLVESTTPYTILVPFSELTASGSDLSNAINLSFDFSQIGPDTEFSLQAIRIVPEPAAFTLFMFGSMTLLSRRRRLTSGCS